MAEVDWKSLIEIARWTPINQLNWPVRELRDGLYEVGENAYLLTGDLDEKYQYSKNGPRAGSLVWAVSAEALACLLSLKTLAVDENADVIPPRALMPDPSEYRCTYASILGQLNASGLRYSESDTYRMDGKFVYRAVNFGLRTYAFRRQDINEDEIPFAIKVILSTRQCGH